MSGHKMTGTPAPVEVEKVTVRELIDFGKRLTVGSVAFILGLVATIFASGLWVGQRVWVGTVPSAEVKASPPSPGGVATDPSKSTTGQAAFPPRTSAAGTQGYLVRVTTGTESNAGTRGTVFLTMIGQFAESREFRHDGGAAAGVTFDWPVRETIMGNVCAVRVRVERIGARVDDWHLTALFIRADNGSIWGFDTNAWLTTEDAHEFPWTAGGCVAQRETVVDKK